MLGGSMIPSEPAAHNSPTANFGGYLLSMRFGIMMEPTAATVAGLEPESAENIMHDTTAVTDTPPVTQPNAVLAKLTSLLDVPPFSIKSPANMKKGIDISVKESTPENMRRAASCMFMPLSMRPITAVNPITIAMGTPSTSNPRNANTNSIISHLFG
jgi:hypothetical protein